WGRDSQSRRSWARSKLMGSQMPSFFDFWKRRIGTESKSIPRLEMLRYSVRVAIGWRDHRQVNTVLPLASSVVSLAFAALVFDQWRRRRHAFQLVWTVGLLFYGV